MKHLAACLLICLASGAASAQLPEGRRSARGVPIPPAPLTLKSRFGVPVAEALLRSQSAEDRQRAFQRLGSIGSTQSLDLLVRAFEPGGPARSAEDRLIAVRALAPHASAPPVRDFLVRIMVGVGSNPSRPEAIDGMIEHAAALALAATGDELAQAALGKALRQPGHVADTARDALLAFPPRNLRPLLADLRSPTRTFAALLGELGDARAVPALRQLVRSAPLEVRPEAALALAKLGVQETLELARYWLEHESRADFQLAGAQILLHFGTPDAASAVARLLLTDQNHALGLELAGGTRLPALSPQLLRLCRAASAEERSALFYALGLTGTREAFSFLEGELSRRATSSAAALALALAPESQAEAVLARALGRDDTRRVAVRASIVRRFALGDTPSGFAAALRELASARSPSDEATLTQASAVVSPERAAELLRHADHHQTRALARLALVPEVARALAERLAVERDPALREVLASGLVSAAAAELVPSNVLVDLIDSGGLGAPLAARALAGRDSPALRPRITLLLASSDALMRSHTALGLGQSQDGSALGLLELAYRFEVDESVRLSIVRAIAARREQARTRALILASTLDGAPAVREAARLGLAGVEVRAAGPGPETAWLEFLRTEAAPPGIFSTSGALVITSDGLAVPAFADADGNLLLPALESGPFTLRLAAGARNDDAPRPRQP